MSSTNLNLQVTYKKRETAPTISRYPATWFPSRYSISRKLSKFCWLKLAASIIIVSQKCCFCVILMKILLFQTVLAKKDSPNINQRIFQLRQGLDKVGYIAWSKSSQLCYTFCDQVPRRNCHVQNYFSFLNQYFTKKDLTS